MGYEGRKFHLPWAPFYRVMPLHLLLLQMVVGKHHYNFQCCPEPACTFYVPNKSDKNAKYKGTAIEAITEPR
uniref:Putative secreted protein n=1 Tax=Ixodes ricinus TaxID=34613 RepID=A0A6B0U2A9_IXORI